jgi:hypothetical protein
MLTEIIKILYLLTQKLYRMRYLCGVVFFFVVLGLSGYAQTDTLRVNPFLSGTSSELNGFLGKLQVRQDSRITDMLVRKNLINQRRNGTEGYRLEIFFSSDTRARERASRVRNEFNLVFPDIRSYLLFQTPNFKVRIGDFRSKSEALKAKAHIASKYPNAFIVRDMIRFPDLYTEPLEQSEEQQ